MNNKLINLIKESPVLWRVTINNPPVNIFGPGTIPPFNEIIAELETDKQVKVVIFESAIDGFFMTHYDFVSPAEETLSMPPGPTGLLVWPDMLVRLSKAPVVSIAKIRGRATGCGSELALACDMRFCSIEKTVMGHFEVGAGIVPGGAPMARLPRLIGRGRAMEVFMGADDIPGDLVERYGYVNRALPDTELDAFVDALARRIASFDKRTLAATKHFVDIASLPSDEEAGAEMVVCYASQGWPETQRRVRLLLEKGLHKAGDVETRLGYHVGQLGKD